MLYLVFGASPRRFAIAGAQVLEVVPLVPLRPLPETPPEVAGIFRYRGNPTPVIDLTRLLDERSSADRLSTRIIVVAYRRPGVEGTFPLGAIAERMTDTLRIAEDELASSGLGSAEAPYLGKIATQSGELVPVIDVERLLPPELRDALFVGDADGRAIDAGGQ